MLMANSVRKLNDLLDNVNEDSKMQGLTIKKTESMVVSIRDSPSGEFNKVVAVVQLFTA